VIQHLTSIIIVYVRMCSKVEYVYGKIHTKPNEITLYINVYIFGTLAHRYVTA